jgi:hypothetical protein
MSLSRRIVAPLDRRKALKLASQFVFFLAIMVAASTFISAGFAWIPRTWGAVYVLLLLVFVAIEAYI